MLDVSANAQKVPHLFFACDKFTPDLAQARAAKEAKPELADQLYAQVEVTLLELAAQQGMKPSDPKGLLMEPDPSETPEQTALRQCIAEVYFEHGEVFDQLKQAGQAQACYQKAQAWGHADAAMRCNLSLSTSDLRFSLGQLPPLPVHYVYREESTKLLELLKNKPTALIEVIGPPKVGKTTLIQRLLRPSLDPSFASYALIAWIDCHSVNSANADIQAISHALGYDSPNPKAALQRVASYVQEHSNSLLILDGLDPSNIDLVLTWLNPSVWSGQLIYTTTQTLTEKLSQSLERSVESLPLSLFTADQAKDLVQQYLPKESLEARDCAQVIRMTGGVPGVIQAMCRYYQATIVSFKDFSDFLAKSEKSKKYQNMQDDWLSEIVQASIKPLEQNVGTQYITNPKYRALNIIKQAAWLGDDWIPFEFFVREFGQVDEVGIQMLYDKQLVMLDIDRVTRRLRLNPAFTSVVQKHYQSEERILVGQNIGRLSEVFSYSIAYSFSQPEDLKRYADMVHTLIFKTNLSEGLYSQRNMVLLSGSLARFYYLYHGELQLAYDCLQKTQRFFKEALSDEQITHFEQAPADFTATPNMEGDDAYFLQLYAEDYLYQSATLASQLVSRGQVAVEVIQDFEKSYAIQMNLGTYGNPETIAYTLRNLSRALRKQGLLLNALEKYQALEQWIDQHPKEFDERTRAELLVDQGIIQKEFEDAKPEEQRNYQPAIEVLRETQRIYLKNDTTNQQDENEIKNQRQALGMLSIYLGEAYLAAGNFEIGITHTCQILYYDGERRERQARAYFNLARAFDNAGYLALAKLFIDKALPLQIEAYQPTTKALSLQIEEKILQHSQQAAPRTFDDQITALKTQESLVAYCEAELLTGSAPSKILSRDYIDVIEAKADNWLLQHYSEANFEAAKLKLAKDKVEVENEIKAWKDKEALQLEKDEQWYRALAQPPENRHALIFAHQFKEALLSQIVGQLRLAYGEKVPMDKIALAEGLIKAVSGALPKIELSATTGVTGTVDLATILQGLTTTLSEWHRSHKEADADIIEGRFREPGQQPKSLQVCDRIGQQIQEMAYYAARCWQPVFSGQDWREPKDIQTLAEYGARRVMEYLKRGTADTLSPQERVVLALMTGEASTRLKQDHLSVRGFFAKPGINIEAEKAVYLPSWTARPNIYGYRLGSPVEARIRPYYGPFKSGAEAQQRAEDERDHQSRCTVM